MEKIVHVTENKPAWMSYFKVMDAEARQQVAEWRANASAVTQEERIFFQRVDEALAAVTEDYALSRMAPEWALFGKRMGFGTGTPINELMSALEWAKFAKEFAPDCNSMMANRHQVILYYASRIAKGKLTLQQVCGSTRPRYRVDEEEIKSVTGNVRYIKEAEQKMALNKRVVYEGDGFAIMGGGGNRRNGAIGAMADVFTLSDPNMLLEKACCLIAVKP